MTALPPNMRETAATTRGIARNMSSDAVEALASGGGDANGSAATFFFGQAGTAANQLGSPRLINAGPPSVAI